MTVARDEGFMTRTSYMLKVLIETYKMQSRTWKG